MKKGTVKWFDPKKGYGFIAGEDGEDYFVHYSNITQEEGFRTLKTDAQVTFDVGEDTSGRVIAKNVIAA